MMDVEMTGPEPWSIDDLPDNEVLDEAAAALSLEALEREAGEYWASPTGRAMSRDIDDMLAAGLDPFNFDRNPAGALAVARWRLERGRDLTARDRETLALALDGKLFKRGRKPVIKSPRLIRKRQLQAAYLRNQGDALEIVAKKMGTGVEARDVPALAAKAGEPSAPYTLWPSLDAELMAEILAEHGSR